MNEQGYTGQNNTDEVLQGNYQRDMLGGQTNENNSTMYGRQNQHSGLTTDIQGKHNDCNLAVLNDVYQNSVMGKQSISNIIPKIEDQDFKQELMKSYENYDKISSKASSEILKLGDRPREKNPLSKAMLWGTINISTLVDNSTSNIAGLVIKGCNNSVNNMTRTLNQHSEGINEDVRKLADDYIKNEQDNITNLQKFL